MARKNGWRRQGVEDVKRESRPDSGMTKWRKGSRRREELSSTLKSYDGGKDDGVGVKNWTAMAIRTNFMTGQSFSLFNHYL